MQRINRAGKAQAASKCFEYRRHWLAPRQDAQHTRDYVGTRALGMIRKNSTTVGANPLCCSSRERFRDQF